MMTRPWITVMSQSMMKIFERDIDTDELKFLKTISNDLGRVHGRFLGRHDRGSVNEGGRRGSHHHTLDAGLNSHNVATDSFAKRIAKFLESERAHGAFSSLTVIAEPKFLGRIRKSMSGETLKTVARWIPKDLEKASTECITEHVLETMRAERSHALARAE